EETNQQEGNSQSGKYNEDAESVVSQSETIEMPVDKEAQAEIVTTFYDYTADEDEDRKSTRLNSSHVSISYAVFCLKKKKLLNQRIIGHVQLVQQLVIHGLQLHFRQLV